MAKNKGKPSGPAKPPAEWERQTKGEKPNRSAATELKRRRPAGRTRPEHRAGGPRHTGAGAGEDRNP